MQNAKLQKPYMMDHTEVPRTHARTQTHAHKCVPEFGTGWTHTEAVLLRGHLSVAAPKELCKEALKYSERDLKIRT